MQIVCQSCQKLIETPEPQQARIINLPTTSMIVMEHPERITCPNCQSVVSFGISSMDGIGLVGIPLPGEQKGSLIVKPNGEAMKLVKG